MIATTPKSGFALAINMLVFIHFSPHFFLNAQTNYYIRYDYVFVYVRDNHEKKDIFLLISSA